jgi:hypothetical protein
MLTNSILHHRRQNGAATVRERRADASSPRPQAAPSAPTLATPPLLRAALRALCLGGEPAPVVAARETVTPPPAAHRRCVQQPKPAGKRRDDRERKPEWRSPCSPVDPPGPAVDRMIVLPELVPATPPWRVEAVHVIGNTGPERSVDLEDALKDEDAVAIGAVGPSSPPAGEPKHKDRDGRRRKRPLGRREAGTPPPHPGSLPAPAAHRAHTPVDPPRRTLGRTHARLLGHGGRDRAALGTLGVGGEAAAVVAARRAQSRAGAADVRVPKCHG